jgi:hypothetical protein
MLGLYLECGVSGKSQPYGSALMVCAAPSGHIRQRYDEDAKLLNDAFTGTYKGDAVDLFCDAMNAYSDTFDPNHYSGRIIAWCGPSGAGKSKGVDALQDRVRA